MSEKTSLTHSFEAIERRRADVLEMLFQGTPMSVITKVLGVDIRTIEGDVEYWRRVQQKRIASLQQSKDAINLEVGSLIQSLELVRQNAFMEYAGLTGSSTRESLAKNAFLNTAMKATQNMARILIETGFLPKAGQEVHISTESKVTYADRFGPDSPLSALDDPVKARKVMAVLDKVFRKSAGKGAPPKLTTDGGEEPK